MKQKNALVLCIVLILAAFSVSVFASSDKEQRLNVQNLAFGRLQAVKYISLTTASGCTPLDITATHTSSACYWSKSYTLPAKIVFITATPSTVLYVAPYKASATYGIDVPTATCGALPWDSISPPGASQATMIFTGEPNVTIAPSAAEYIRVMIWGEP